MPVGRYEEAARIAAGVPVSHPTFFEARREMLYAMLELYLIEEEGESRAAARRLLLEAAEELLDQSESIIADQPAQRLEQAVTSLADNTAGAGGAAAGGNDEALASLHRLGTALSAAGHARLVLAQLAEDDMQTAEALRLLEDFETKFQADIDLAREGASRRISVLITGGRIPEAGEEAERMMNRFEDDAVGTVNQVVNSLERQIDQLRRQLGDERGRVQRERIEQRVQTLSQVLVTLTDQLQRWASRQNYDTREMLPFRMIRIKALCLAGQGAEAVTQAQVLYEAFPQDANVIHYMGEALYTRGMNNDSAEDLTVAVTRHFDVLIAGLEEDKPPLFWHAWMRRLQVMDHLEHAAGDIPIRVNGLRRLDRGLGGEPYRSALEYLYRKHD
jgi:vacuolar-type H+-ATPase subunit H